MNKAKEKLISLLPTHVTLLKFTFKDSKYVAVLHAPGIYFEPLPQWDIKWINFEDHDLCITMGLSDFNFHYE